MNNPGPFQLTAQGGSAFQLNQAGTFIGWDELHLEGMHAVSLQFGFKYVAGGTTATAYVQTSLDQGQSWIDIAAVQFTTASGTQMVNLSGLTPVDTPVAPNFFTLAPGTVQDGILGDRLRAAVVVTGTYTGSTQINITGVAR
jgi:hypothetical protein